MYLNNLNSLSWMNIFPTEYNLFIPGLCNGSCTRSKVYTHLSGEEIRDQQIVSEYYEKGFVAGSKKKAKGVHINSEPTFEKHSYKKPYREGYRVGWDSEKTQKVKKLGPEDKAFASP